MSTVFDSEGMVLSADRLDITRQMREMDAPAGVVYDPTMTHEKLRAMMRELMQAQGIRPEDNIGSRELLRMRYGDDGGNG